MNHGDIAEKAEEEEEEEEEEIELADQTLAAADSLLTLELPFIALSL